MKKLADIGLIGLAVMGENLVLNMAGKGFAVAVHNRTAARVDSFLAGRARGLPISGYHEVRDFVEAIARPRKVMMMLKAGEAVDQFIGQLLPATHFMTAVKTLFLAGNVPSLVLPNAALLVGYALFFFGAALVVTRKRLD